MGRSKSTRSFLAASFALGALACAGNADDEAASGTAMPKTPVTPVMENMPGPPGQPVPNPVGMVPVPMTMPDPPVKPLPKPTTGFIASKPSASTRLPRLSYRQWESTVRDLFVLPALPNLSPTFISEPSRSAFDNNGAVLQIGPALWSDFQNAAEVMADRVVKDPMAVARIVPANAPADVDAKARAFIASFGLRAFRRPLGDAEIEAHFKIFKLGSTLGGTADPFLDGLQVLLTAFLQSPHFLYRPELSTALVDGKVPLTDYEIASRLSYGLIGTMPDAPLFAAAAAKKLQSKDEVLAQAARLLARAGAQELVLDFHNQLLNVGKYDFINKDAKKFPTWTGSFNGDMKNETRSFIRDVVFTQDKGVAELFTAPYSFVNARLASLYGIMRAAPVMGQPDPLTKTMLDETRRSGLLTQLGFLSAYADGREPNTITRGAFTTLEMMCVELPPPPDDIPALPPPSPTKTNRQRVEGHTQEAACAGCHKTLINPAGFALENFDALGQWREMDVGKPVDASSAYLIDGEMRAFKGPVEFSRLLASSQQLHQCFARHWLEYVHGRTVSHADPADHDLMVQLGARSLVAKASIKQLLLDAVTTDSFLTRAPQ